MSQPACLPWHALNYEMHIVLQDRYARTSIRNSTCDAVLQGSVLGSTRPLKLEPNHDVARLCGRSLVGRHRSTRHRAPSTPRASRAHPSSRFALALFCVHRLQCGAICLPSTTTVTVPAVTVTVRV